jgi:hypothetical protein
MTQARVPLTFLSVRRSISCDRRHILRQFRFRLVAAAFLGALGFDVAKLEPRISDAQPRLEQN